MEPLQQQQRKSFGRKGFFSRWNFGNLSRKYMQLAKLECDHFETLMQAHFNHLKQMREALTHFLRRQPAEQNSEALFQMKENLETAENTVMRAVESTHEHFMDMQGRPHQPTMYFTKTEISMLMDEVSNLLKETNRFCERAAQSLFELTGIDIQPEVRERHVNVSGYQTWNTIYKQGRAPDGWRYEKQNMQDDERENLLVAAFDRKLSPAKEEELQQQRHQRQRAAETSIQSAMAARAALKRQTPTHN